jgi:hypothetical protein
MSKARLINLMLVASLFVVLGLGIVGKTGMSDGGGFHFL